MPKLTKILLTLAVCAMGSSASFGTAPDDDALLVDLLFPESASWQTLADLPEPDPSWLARQLERIRLFHRLSPETKSGPCSTIGRLTGDSTYRASGLFRVLDVDADGTKDLLYSGGSPCAEAPVTLIWMHAWPDVTDRAPLQFPFELLKVQPGPDPNMVLAKPGCCGDPMTSYLSSRLSRPHSGTQFAIDTRMELPSPNLEIPTAETRFTAESELVLRSEPTVNDAYDASQSDFAGRAVFGNVSRKYMRGVTARVLGSVTDPQGARWSLVAVDRSHLPQVFYEAWPADVGWVAR